MGQGVEVEEVGERTGEIIEMAVCAYLLPPGWPGALATSFEPALDAAAPI